MAEQMSEHSPRPGGREQGVMILRVLPHELRQRYGWEFEVGEDDLGSMLFAFLRLASGAEHCQPCLRMDRAPGRIRTDDIPALQAGPFDRSGTGAWRKAEGSNLDALRPPAFHAGCQPLQQHLPSYLRKVRESNS